MIDVDKVLAKYEIGAIKKISPISYLTNADNKVFKIHTTRGSYVLKKINAEQTEVNKEIFLVSFFIKKGALPENYIIKTKNGKKGVKSGGFSFVLLRYIEGSTLFEKIVKKELNSGDVKKIAVACSRLDNGLNELKLDKVDYKDYPSIISESLSKSRMSDEDQRLIKELVSKYEDYRDSLRLRKQVVLELQPLNVIISEDKAYFIDFGFIREGSEIENIIQILLIIFISDNTLNYEHLRIFLKNYSPVFQKNELGLLLYFLKLEMCGLWTKLNSKGELDWINKIKEILSFLDFKNLFKSIMDIKEEEFRKRVK